MRIVNNESCIRYDNYYYHVPPEHMFETCPIRIKDNRITIYSPDFVELKKYEIAQPGSKQRYIGLEKQSVKKDYLPAKQLVCRLESFGWTMKQYIDTIQ